MKELNTGNKYPSHNTFPLEQIRCVQIICKVLT